MVAQTVRVFCPTHNSLAIVRLAPTPLHIPCLRRSAETSDAGFGRVFEVLKINILLKYC